MAKRSRRPLLDGRCPADLRDRVSPRLRRGGIFSSGVQALVQRHAGDVPKERAHGLLAGRRPVRSGRWAAIALCALALGRCGGGPTTPTGDGTPTITITASGVTPTQVTVHVGDRVTFLNSDIRIHAMSSDPITVHTDCPAINDVGLLNPGQSRSTGVFDVARVCGFHDHTNELDPTWHGTIVVQ